MDFEKKEIIDCRSFQDIHASGDHLIQALAYSGEIRAMAIDAKYLVRAFQEAHKSSKLITDLVGRLMIGTAFLATDLKLENSNLSVSLSGNGSVGKLQVVCNESLELRAAPQDSKVSDGSEEGEAQSLSALVGQGLLNLVRDDGSGHFYTGSVAIKSGNVSDELIEYLYQSEQRPSTMLLSLVFEEGSIKAARGVFIEALPGASEAYREKLAFRLQNMPSLDWMIDEGFDPAECLDLILGDPDIIYLKRRDISYFCPCSHLRMEANLITLGKEVLEDLSKEPQGIEITCHFCEKKYHFNQEDLSNLATSC